MLARCEIGDGKVSILIGHRISAAGGNYTHIRQRIFALIEFPIAILIEPDPAGNTTRLHQTKVHRRFCARQQVECAGIAVEQSEISPYRKQIEIDLTVTGLQRLKYKVAI